MDKHGFTLVELMIALVIFAIGIVGVVKLQMASVAGNAYSMRLSQAITYAQNDVENLKGLTYNRTTGPIEYNVTGIHGLSDIISSQGIRYSRQYNVNSNTNGAVDISVTVSWPEKFNNPSVTLRFLRSQN